MKKLLIICGPTATGKTALGLRLAKKLDGEILSADSRQVYKGMDIGTGKDVGNSKFISQNLELKPKTQKLDYGYYWVDKIRIWGLDIVEPKYPFNVADYVRYATVVLRDIWKRGKLPIIVGGTGLYINSVLEPPETINVKPNFGLRKRIEKYSLNKLQQTLRRFDISKWNKMNDSDRINPRRLIRAIEVARTSKKRLLPREWLAHNLDILKIGLTAPREVIYQKIDKRLKNLERVGMDKEVQRLQGERVSPASQSMSGTGYQVFTKNTRESRLRLWQYADHAYARRQLTWFSRDREIHWFDISSSDWSKKVAKLASDWYTSGNTP
jgi:tRNA dimethylallyltransferase